MFSLARSILVALAALVPAVARALELPAVLGDHMVLQREQPVPIWGKAQAGQAIAVRFGDAEPLIATTGASGQWRVDLPAMRASNDGRDLTIAVVAPQGQATAATETITLRDVVVGEVWHCSGQSNMSLPVSESTEAAADIAAANFPLIRFFTQPQNSSPQPLFTGGGNWVVCSPQTIGGFSAVGYHFGRLIHADLGVPVGLIDTSWGGAAGEAYVSFESVRGFPLAHNALYHRVVAERAKPGSIEPRLMTPQHIPGNLFNGMVHPIAPYGVRGVLWYQGEANTADLPGAYLGLMQRLMADWRTLWTTGGPAKGSATSTMPFLIVQLPHFEKPDEQPVAFNTWADFRLIQHAITKQDAHAFLATAIDVGDAADIHPRNKREVGRRLSLQALRNVYGRSDVAANGPQLTQLSFDAAQPSTVTIQFAYAEGLRTRDGKPPRGFAVRQQGTGAWHWASATLDGDKVVLTAPAGMVGPFDVRYAYGTNPTDGPHGINLVNAAGLPALPFDTAWTPTGDRNH